MNTNNPTAPASMATPLPWHVGMKPGPMIYGPQGEQIAGLTGALSFNARPDAQFIVRACNSHAALVAIAELAAKREPEMMDKAEMRAVLVNLYEMARAALTAAQS